MEIMKKLIEAAEQVSPQIVSIMEIMKKLIEASESQYYGNNEETD
jgi:hypothetical protein